MTSKRAFIQTGNVDIKVGNIQRRVVSRQRWAPALSPAQNTADESERRRRHLSGSDLYLLAKYHSLALAQGLKNWTSRSLSTHFKCINAIMRACRPRSILSRSERCLNNICLPCHYSRPGVNWNEKNGVMWNVRPNFRFSSSTDRRFDFRRVFIDHGGDGFDNASTEPKTCLI